MMNYGNRPMKDLDRDTDRDHTLANRHGKILRKIGTYPMVSKFNLPPYRAARVALFYVLCKADLEKAKEVQAKYSFDMKYLKLVAMLQAASR